MIKIITEDVEMPDLHQRRYQLMPLANYKWQVLDTNTWTSIKEGTFEDMFPACQHLNKSYYLENPILKKADVKYIFHHMDYLRRLDFFRLHANATVFAVMSIRSNGSLNIYDIHGEDPKIIDSREKGAIQNTTFPIVENTTEELKITTTPFSDFVTRLLYDLTHYADITINDKGHLTIHQLVGTSPTINDLRKNK